MTNMQALYDIQDNFLILDNTNRTYFLKVRDLPPDKKPREKLIAQGPSALSNPELLAVILQTGTKKEEVLAMARRVLKEYGERNFSSHKDPKALAQDAGIPEIKAAQIVACVELGRRFFKQRNGCSATLRTAKDVFEYVLDMRNAQKEHLRGIYVNAHHRVVHDEMISIGTVDANIIHPREVFKPAIEHSAAAVILVHNHPSGVTTPSAADIEITEQLVAAGKTLGLFVIDHVIVTAKAFASIPVSYE